MVSIAFSVNIITSLLLHLAVIQTVTFTVQAVEVVGLLYITVTSHITPVAFN